MNNPILTLINCVSASYLNSTLEMKNERVIDVARTVIRETNLPTDQMGDGGIGDIVGGLVATFEWVSRLNHESGVTQTDVIKRLRINVGFDNIYLEAVESGISYDESDPLAASRRMTAVLSELDFELEKIELSRLFQKAHKRVCFENDPEIHDYIRSFSTDLKERVDKIDRSTSDTRPLSLKDIAALTACINSSNELNSNEGKLRAGLQGLNLAQGCDANGGSFIRGLLYNFAALTHNYKSGILLDFCRWFCMHNKPYMTKSDKKPAIIRFSFENKQEQDLPLIIKSLWEAKFQKKYDPAEVPPEEAAKFIADSFGRNGYEFFMECHDPNNFDVWKLIDVIEGYIAAGYEVHAIIVDYPELLARNASNNMRKDQQINSIFEILRNFCWPKGITQITAHQLSTDAAMLVREGTANLVSKVKSGGYFQDSKSLDTKFDGSYVMHIHKSGGNKYLMFANGKHRGGESTIEAHKTFAYPFAQYGGIVDDVDGEAKYIRNVNSLGVSDVDAPAPSAALTFEDVDF